MSGWESAQYTLAGSTRFYAASLGDPAAPNVVCVHGIGCSHRYFLPVARALARDGHVVAPDLPGFGRTRGPRRALDVRGLSLALADWLRATGRGGSVLLANSMGCQVVVDLAVHAPELLGPVVLAGPTVDRGARTVRQQVARLLVDVRWERPSLVPVLSRDYLVCGPRRYAETLAHILNDRVEDKLGHVRSPCIVVRGERDIIVSRGWALDVVAGLPRAHLVEIPGAGHTLNWSAPDELAAVVRPLLLESSSPD